MRMPVQNQNKTFWTQDVLNLGSNGLTTFSDSCSYRNAQKHRPSSCLQAASASTPQLSRHAATAPAAPPAATIQSTTSPRSAFIYCWLNIPANFPIQYLYLLDRLYMYMSANLYTCLYICIYTLACSCSWIRLVCCSRLPDPPASQSWCDNS